MVLLGADYDGNVAVCSFLKDVNISDDTTLIYPLNEAIDGVLVLYRRERGEESDDVEPTSPRSRIHFSPSHASNSDTMFRFKRLPTAASHHLPPHNCCISPAANSPLLTRFSPIITSISHHHHQSHHFYSSHNANHHPNHNMSHHPHHFNNNHHPHSQQHHLPQQNQTPSQNHNYQNHSPSSTSHNLHSPPQGFQEVSSDEPYTEQTSYKMLLYLCFFTISFASLVLYKYGKYQYWKRYKWWYRVNSCLKNINQLQFKIQSLINQCHKDENGMPIMDHDTAVSVDLLVKDRELAMKMFFNAFVHATSGNVNTSTRASPSSFRELSESVTSMFHSVKSAAAHEAQSSTPSIFSWNGVFHRLDTYAPHIFDRILDYAFLFSAHPAPNLTDNKFIERSKVIPSILQFLSTSPFSNGDAKGKLVKNSLTQQNFDSQSSSSNESLSPGEAKFLHACFNILWKASLHNEKASMDIARLDGIPILMHLREDLSAHQNIKKSVEMVITNLLRMRATHKCLPREQLLSLISDLADSVGVQNRKKSSAADGGNEEFLNDLLLALSVDSFEEPSSSKFSTLQRYTNTVASFNIPVISGLLRSISNSFNDTPHTNSYESPHLFSLHPYMKYRIHSILKSHRGDLHQDFLLQVAEHEDFLSTAKQTNAAMDDSLSSILWSLCGGAVLGGAATVWIDLRSNPNTLYYVIQKRKRIAFLFIMFTYFFDQHFNLLTKNLPVKPVENLLAQNLCSIEHVYFMAKLFLFCRVLIYSRFIIAPMLLSWGVSQLIDQTRKDPHAVSLD